MYCGYPYGAPFIYDLCTEANPAWFGLVPAVLPPPAQPAPTPGGPIPAWPGTPQQQQPPPGAQQQGAPMHHEHVGDEEMNDDHEDEGVPPRPQTRSIATQSILTGAVVSANDVDESRNRGSQQSTAQQSRKRECQLKRSRWPRPWAASLCSLPGGHGRAASKIALSAGLPVGERGGGTLFVAHRRKKTDPDAKQDEKLTGAWLHLANGRKRPLEKAHWCTKRKTRPESAFWAPKVCCCPSILLIYTIRVGTEHENG